MWLRSPLLQSGISEEEGMMFERPIRVLHVIGRMNRGGAETIIMNLYRSIDRSKIQFDFLVHTNEQCDYDQEIISLGGRIYSIIPFTGKNVAGYRRACRTFFRSHDDIDIVHGHIGSSAALYLSIAKKYGKYTIAHSHAQKFPISLGEIAFRIASYPTRYIADSLIACSEQAGIDRFGNRFKRDGNHFVLKNGVDLNQFKFDPVAREEVRRELSIPADAIVVGHVGRFDPIKNHDFLIDVFERIASAEPSAHLVLLGREDEGRSIRRRCESMGMMDSVHIVGVRGDVHRVLSAFDVFVFPSVKEGLPLSCIEAQSSGLPCVISTGASPLVFVTERAHRASLAEGALAWASMALALARESTVGTREQPVWVDSVREAGFDIVASAQWLQSFYLDRYAEMKGAR